MKNKEFFYLSEIILGLREEYNNTRKQLDDLKSMLILGNNVDASLGVWSKFEKGVQGNIERHNYLVIKYEEKAEGLKRLINELSMKLKNYTLKKEFACDFDWSRYYIFANDERKFNVANETDFQKKTYDVLHTDFNLGALDTYTKLEDENMSVKVGHNGVYCVTDNFKRFAPNTGFDYYAYNDQLVLNNYYGNPAFAAGINEVMNTPIPRSIVNSRIARIVEENPKSILPITFEGLTNTKKPQSFNLIEEDDKVVALRVR